MATQGPGSMFSIDLNHGERILEAKAGNSLLVGLAGKGIFMPSACGGKGKCGYCKAKVLTSTGPLSEGEQKFLTPSEQAAGFRLCCQLLVDRDLALEMPKDYFGAKRYLGKVVSKRPLTHDIVELRIALPPSKNIEFSAGQFVQLRSTAYEGHEPVLRAYSLASPPSQKQVIELIIKRVPNGIGTAWVFDHLQEGEDVQFTGPYGDVRLSDAKAPLLFVAGGSGMAPVWSMLQYMRESKDGRNARFFFGALTQKDLFLVDELRQMERDMPGFSFVPALSNEPADSGWSGERGLITDVVDRSCPDCTGREAYLCGSPGMINACLKVLEKNGLPKEKIFFDKFG
jgi:Na+-transporting NADH:ubiquinone oxidoreductase subunit F